MMHWVFIISLTTTGNYQPEVQKFEYKTASEWLASRNLIQGLSGRVVLEYNEVRFIDVSKCSLEKA